MLGNHCYVDNGPPFIVLMHPALGPLWDVIRQKVQLYVSSCSYCLLIGQAKLEGGVYFCVLQLGSIYCENVAIK